MSGDIAAAADVITGALAARAVESQAGEGQGKAGALCLNCGTRLIGAHCHACGQSGHVHRTVGAIGHEIAHGVFHFEGKIWRTLPLLIFRPGALTRRYVGGERARFVSPLAVFLFTVFLMFAVISAVGGEVGDEPGTPEGLAARAEYNTQVAQARDALAKAEARQAAAARSGDAGPAIDDQVAALRTTVRGLEIAGGVTSTDGTRRFTFTDLATGWPRLDHGIAKANANPGLAIYKLQSSAYKYSWLLIPLSTPFVALLFLWRRRYGLYDHAVFVTYSLAFMMLMTIALTLIGAARLGGDWMPIAVLLIPPVHMFAQLRGAYSLRAPSALWRTVLLLIFAFLALTAFLVLLLLHGLAE